MLTNRIGAALLILCAGGSIALPALAGFTLYDQDGTRIVINADIVGAGFLNSNSWFGESEAFLGEDTDEWAEFGFEPKLSLEMPLGSGTLFGEVSGVYTDSFDDDASGLSIGLDDTDDLRLEQGHLGWRVDDPFAGLEDDTLSITLGRQDYTIGTGLILADGGGDGGERGGWFIGMRKAFQEAIIVSLKSKTLVAEGFRVRNRPRFGGNKGEAYGGNLEYTFVEQRVTVGGTYLQVDGEFPNTDALDVFSGRLNWTVVENFSVGGEYVHQTSDDADADGWYAEAAYDLPAVTWTPRLSYRYAHFDGDDPTTADNERYSELAYGFTDYGYWYQGEITGNYPLGLGNLLSHQVRVKAQPTESLTLNLIYYNFGIDEPQSLGVTSDDWGDEINLAADWSATDKLYIIGVFGVLFPGKGAEQLVGGDDDWVYSMLYASYSW